MDYVIKQKELKNDSSTLISHSPINTINSNNEHVSSNDKKEDEQSQEHTELNTHYVDSNETQKKESDEDYLIDDQKIKKEARSKVAKSSPSRSFIGFSNNDNEYEKYIDYTNIYPLGKINAMPLGPGKVGLDNIGNTCFFNSGIQCLSHMNCLVDYFESSKWKSELNTQNPLGMHGEIAIAFAELVHVLWKGEIVSFNPSKLKSVIGQFAHQFSGNEQQDVHELITFLLDGLHEDLNRRIDKPITENVFGNGINDEETAGKAWLAHKLRNDSIIVDLFHGQLRSKLDCPRCKCTTTVFDPYITLSVPLVKPENSSSQQKRQKKLKITYIPRDFSQKYKFFIIDINGNESIYDICRMIKQKAKTSKSVVIGRFDQVSNEIVWGLANKETQKKRKKKKSSKNDSYSDEENGKSTSYNSRPHSHSIFDGIFNDSDEISGNDNENDDDDSGEYIAFEIVDVDYNQYWIPCFLKMKVNNFLSSIEKNVIGPFLLPCIDDSPTEKELSDICETVISSIWEEYPESGSEDEVNDKVASQSASDVDSDFASDNDSSIKSNKSFFDGGKQSFFSKTVFSDYIFEDDSPVKVSKDEDIIFDENYQFLANSIVTARISKKATEDKNFSLKRLLVNFDQRTSSPLSMSNPFDKEHIEKISLEKCLKYFSMKETLDSKNMWFCPHCREFVCAEKKMDIWSTPKNLILHLKRFITAEYSFGQINSKLTTKVDYPLLLDMDPYIIGPNKKSSNLYRLKAVSEHVGTAGGGHYTAVALVDENYSKNKNKKKIKKNNSESESDSDDECLKWYLFNDSIVSKVPKKLAVSKDAYVLFYERMYDDHGEKNNDSVTDFDSKEEEEEEEEEEAKAEKVVDDSNTSEHQSPTRRSNDNRIKISNQSDDEDETTTNDYDDEKDYEETVNENEEKSKNAIVNNEISINKLTNEKFNEKGNNDQINQFQFFNNENVQLSNESNINLRGNVESSSQIKQDLNNNESDIQNEEANKADNNGEGSDDQFENEEEEEEEENNDHQVLTTEEKNQQPSEQIAVTEVIVRNELAFNQQTPKMESNRERNHFISNDDEDENNDDVVDDGDNSNCHVC